MAEDSSPNLNWLWLLIIVVFVVPKVSDSVLYGTWRYALQYRVPPSRVIKSRQPHDCDWLHAPLGDKNCHYDPAVTYAPEVAASPPKPADRTAQRPSGELVVSHDDGVTFPKRLKDIHVRCFDVSRNFEPMFFS